MYLKALLFAGGLLGLSLSVTHAADLTPATIAGFKTVTVVSSGSGGLASSGGYRATLGADTFTTVGFTSNIGDQSGTYRYVKIDATRAIIFSTESANGHVTISGLTFTSASSASVVSKSFNPGTGPRSGPPSLATTSTSTATAAVVTYKDNTSNFTANVNWNLNGTLTPTVTSNAGASTGSQEGTLVFEGVALPNRLINVSSRSKVLTGDDILIAGFVVSGTASKLVLIRALGPTLIPFGVTGALADPVLTIFNSASSVVGSNDNWTGSEISAVAKTVGAAPLTAGSLDAAVLLTLSPGSYSVQIKGKGTATGVALAEVYEVP